MISSVSSRSKHLLSAVAETNVFSWIISKKILPESRPWVHVPLNAWTSACLCLFIPFTHFFISSLSNFLLIKYICKNFLYSQCAYKEAIAAFCAPTLLSLLLCSLHLPAQGKFSQHCLCVYFCCEICKCCIVFNGLHIYFLLCNTMLLRVIT